MRRLAATVLAVPVLAALYVSALLAHRVDRYAAAAVVLAVVGSMGLGAAATHPAPPPSPGRASTVEAPPVDTGVRELGTSPPSEGTPAPVSVARGTPVASSVVPGVVASSAEASAPPRRATTDPGTSAGTVQPAPAGILAVNTTMDIPFTSPVDCGPGRCSVMLDVYAPTAAGPWPVVVLLRGGPGGLGARTALAAFAEAIAAHGVVVLNADYRDNARSGGGFPRPFDDVACAIRFARTVAGRWGGDASSVTLVGHSLGAYVGSVVSLSPDTYGSACLASSGSGIPDAFVGISGPYLLGEQDVHAALATVLGGEPGELPDAWARADPLALATTPRTVHVGLVHGTTDKTVDVQASRSLANALADAGDSVLFRERPAGDHGTVVDPTTSDGQSSIALIVAFSRGRLPQS